MGKYRAWDPEQEHYHMCRCSETAWEAPLYPRLATDYIAWKGHGREEMLLAWRVIMKVAAVGACVSGSLVGTTEVPDVMFLIFALWRSEMVEG